MRMYITSSIYDVANSSCVRNVMRTSLQVNTPIRWSADRLDPGRVLDSRGKEHHIPRWVLVGCSSPLLRPWARRWINHLSLWRMASAKLYLSCRMKTASFEFYIIVWELLTFCYNHFGEKYPIGITWKHEGKTWIAGDDVSAIACR